MADDIAPEPEGEAPPPTGSQVAAILMMLLGEDEAAKVLSRLDPD